ncbi:hypothetical protein [Mangrovicoccus algicola]|uniref:Uncharacterized protein n=1 Tax=Mangrovicoccus algicola TaxID=2771008 RepID=A0A8J7CJ51_9RHOB|nr:hypothetical protein [Mangrovicoccus algicola]MBE3637291.1 hypothetical protein [Mangrovicoccus algicola]
MQHVEQKVAQHGAKPVWWPLEEGAAVNRWLVTPAAREIFPGTARVHPDQVDYRFVNGWVATGDLPCREAFRKILPGLDPQIPAAESFSEVYLGGENPRVDFTTFCFRPTRIARFARALIRAEEAQSVTFEIETCGVVHLWAGERLVAVHAPLDRNIPHKARVAVALPAGVTALTVRIEDLHERDTSCFFRLGLVAGQGLSAGLQAAVDPERLRDVEKTLAALRTTRLFHEEGQLAVVCDHTPAEPVEVMLHDGQSADGSATMNVLADRLPLKAPVRFTVTRAGEVHRLFDVAGIAPGCYALVFSVQAGAVRLDASLGTTIMGEVARLEGATLAERKARARARIAAEPGTSISRALLLLREGGDAGEIERIFRHTMRGINDRHDCADFWILPLIWAWRAHAGTGVAQPLWDEVRRAILDFRYWLDEPGNDVMWFWSENHAFCFHVAQFLAGDTFPDEVFPNSGRSGAGHREAARIRLGRWFDSVEDHGLAEWNSSCYYPIDLLGLFTLEACSPDADLKARAKALIDSIFVMTALHSVDGMPVGSQGRVYEKELFAGPATELGAVAAIAFGGIWCPGHERAAALFAVSDYAPPAACDALHRLEGHDRLEARYVQGLNQNAKLALWKSAASQLSAVTGHRTGDPGHQQHVAEIQFAAHPLARTWINHPGELKVWGGGRPSYWMANGVVPRVCMEGNVAALVYDLDRHDHPVRFTHAFAPAELLDDCIEDGQWLFQRAGEGYAALWASAPLERLETGLYKGQEWRAHAAQAGWLMVAGSAATDGGFAAFCARARALAPVFDAAALRLDWQAGGATLSADFAAGLLRDGAAVPFAPLSITPHAGFDGAPLTAVEF